MAHFWQATFQHVLPLQFTMAGHPQDTELHATLVAKPMRLIVAQNGPKKKGTHNPMRTHINLVGITRPPVVTFTKYFGCTQCNYGQGVSKCQDTNNSRSLDCLRRSVAKHGTQVLRLTTRPTRPDKAKVKVWPKSAGYAWPRGRGQDTCQK